MRAILVVIGVTLAVIAQATVAPLFPLSSATPDFVLATLLVVAVYGGPRRAMIAVPLAALLLSFNSDRSAGLLLLGYLPLLPLAAMLAGANAPLNRFAQSLLAGIATGLWSRIVLSLAAMANGADPQVTMLITAILIPGVILDILLLSAAYLPFRLAGASARSLSLARTGYYT